VDAIIPVDGKQHSRPFNNAAEKCLTARHQAGARPLHSIPFAPDALARTVREVLGNSV
jgi:hypothetical protein